MENKKRNEYFTKLLSAVNEVFNEDSENYIGINDLTEGENLTDFIHAISNLVPCYVYNKLTKQDEKLLGFNHISNTLIFQNTDK